MKVTVHRDISLRFSCIVCFLFIFSVQPLFAQNVYLCVWRNPERTMTKIFPDARDYKTLSIPISENERKVIEQRLGFELLPGQQDRFQYFEMTGDEGQVVGTIIAASQKGEYGAVEFVFGLDKNLIIENIYIQRARERDQSFKKRAFLDQFVGLSLDECINLGSSGAKDPTPGNQAVFRGVVKELVSFETLLKTNLLKMMH